MRRVAARVVLLDPEDRVLLLLSSDPARPGSGRWWELPGGGIEPGETSDVAAARELHEETGIEAVEMSPCVWRQHAVFSFAGYDFDQHEYVHVARCRAGVEYRPAGLEALEALAFHGARWWGCGELPAMLSAGGRLTPPWLPEQLGMLLAAGAWPVEPIDMGDLPDVI